jgi:hypothetical protein
MRDLSRVIRALGVTILGLTGIGIGAGLVRLGYALANHHPGLLIVGHLRDVLAFTIVGVFGWMVCSGHRRARNYEWAIIGPYAVGLFTPLGVLTLIVNVAATALNRMAAGQAAPAVDAEVL